MRDTLHDSLRKLRWHKIRKHRMFVILLVLSLIVSADVFWALRQPGLTLAGDAACGIQEHHHDETCRTQTCICEITDEQHAHEETCFVWETSCGLEEHSHEIICYSDETADVETQLDWQEMFAAYPYTGDVRKDLVGIAQTQVGYSESEMNYEVGADGVRRGYTRYGAWYGAPYGDWSAMFVSFCLHYAGGDPAGTPGNTGADSMARLWDNLDKYAPAGTYTPVPGDLVFFNDNTVGIVTEVQNATFYVIRGDVNEAVCGEVMSLNDPSIDGWGLTEGTATEAYMPL
ncbi:MAG: CHAP domain-containing protein, partial [Firmicutes bacterium]|nr:CHAP domain-containing protein [Bacillota bacterium]